jgi:pyruvate/2-oxoglutarate dehydrogenase complex dihydrolipoamide dehydrogenase (E3) component
MTEQVDVVVLGLGPGGEEVAGRLAEEGLAVVGIDGGLVGGECPYWGCVPSKMMIRAANLLAEADRIPGMAGTSSVTADWAPVAARIRADATDDWDDRVAVERLESKGARFVRGWGRLDGPRRVVVGDDHYEARRAVVVGTGAKAWFPPVVPGLAELEGRWWTNREAIETEHVPESLVVLGGGAIGVELGQVFARFGSQVTIVEVADRIVTLEEPEASTLLTGVLEREGVRIVTGVRIAGVHHDGARFSLDLGSATVTGDALLVATGRHPDLSAINATSIGVADDARALPVDEHMRVADGVWAVGDVTGHGAFTHVSMYQAAIVVADILGRPHAGADYRALPRVTFTDPEVGSVGLTEADARRSGVPIRTVTYPLPSSARGWIHKVGNDGFIKLVEDSARGVLVGATSAGPAGGEVLSMLTLAVHAEIPVDRLRTMIYAYPTFHRAVEGALGELASS